MVFRSGLSRASRALLTFVAVVTLLSAGLPAAWGSYHPVTGPQLAGLPGAAPFSMVPTATLQPPSSLPIQARDIVFSRDGSRAFATSYNGFSVIDVATDTVSASVAVPGAWNMVVTPDETTAIIAAGLGDPNVTFVDLASLRVTAAVPAGQPFSDLALAPNGSTVYVTENAADAGSVTAIDVATRTVKKKIPVGNHPGLPIFVAGGTKLYVPNTYDDTISVINTASNTVTKTIPAPVTLNGALSVDGSRVYYPSNMLGSVGLTVVSVANDTVTGTVKTTSAPSTPVFTPDGKTAYIVDQEPGRYVNGRYEAGAFFVAKVDLATNTSTALSNGYSGREEPVVQISPDGKRLYIVGGFAVVQALPSNKVLATTYMSRAPVSFDLEPGGTKGYGKHISHNTVVLSAPVIEHVRKDFNSDGATDVLARDTAGALWLYPGNANADWLPRKQVGTGWNAMTLISTPGDFNGDRNPDVLARDSAGDLWLYPGNGASDWLPRTKIGTGWNAMTAVVTPGDFNGDNKADILARDTAGNLWLYPGNGTGGWLPRTMIGTGWNDMTTILGPGNTSEPGNDILARDTAGQLWLYQRTPTGQWLDRQLVGLDWNVMTAMLTPGDLNGDDRPDLLARDNTGNLWLYPGTQYGGYEPRIRVGTGWNVMTTIT